MKTFTVGLCLILALIKSSETFGQFNKGRWLAGGNAYIQMRHSQYNFNGTDIKTRTTSFSLGPQAGYFVIDRLALGARLSLNVSASTGESIDITGIVDAKSNSYYIALGPFIRYYLPARVFFQLSTEFGTGKYSSEIGGTSNEGDSKNFDYSALVGYAYFLNDYVAIEPTIGYHSNGASINDSDSRSGYFYISAGFTIYLGERK